MRAKMLVLIFVSLVACDENDPTGDSDAEAIAALNAEVDSLKDEIVTLRAWLAGVQAMLNDRFLVTEAKAMLNEAALNDASPTLAASEELLSLMHVEDGDVVVEGANLRVRWNGVGGKGNVIIGDDKPRAECSGGTSPGKLCTIGFDEYCSGGVCEEVAEPQKNGHHNLVIGSGHRYPGAEAIVAGRSSTVGSNSAVLSGQNNTADNSGVVVNGISNNASTERYSVILGGNEQSTTFSGQTIPSIE
jgi:hypothetical protein